MVDFFDYLYKNIRDKNKLLKKLYFYSAQRIMVRSFANLLLPLYFKLTSNFEKYSLKLSANSNNQIIVSLTTFPARVNKVWLVIESILRQAEKPDKLILWLSREQFEKESDLPSSLLKLKRRGLEIRIVAENIRSHKKYYYTLKEFPDFHLITIDDDIFYPSDMISDLLDGHKLFPEAIVGRYGFEILTNGNNIAFYNQWNLQCGQKKPSHLMFFGSGGGTFFPANSLSKETLNKDIFMKICSLADDIWLNTMIRLNGKKVFILGNKQCSLLPVTIANNESLSNINLNENLNDKQLREVRNYYILKNNIDPYHKLFN